MFPFYTNKRVSDMFPYFTDKRVTDMFHFSRTSYRRLTSFSLSLTFPLKPSFWKKRATISKKRRWEIQRLFLGRTNNQLIEPIHQWLRPSYRLLLWDIRAVMIGKHIKNRGVKQKSALRHPAFSYSMGDTLISPIVASYLLYLAVTYTLIRTYLDKPDNLHFNGDYRKKLNCSHYYLGKFMYDWTNNILYAKYPLGKPKKTDTPFRERMPALICHTLPK